MMSGPAAEMEYMSKITRGEEKNAVVQAAELRPANGPKARPRTCYVFRPAANEMT
jgi:hypothetical protein